MLTRTAHLSLRSLRYLEAGSGRPLVLLHAFPLSADQWLPQLHRVPPGWRYIAPDLRGFRGTGPAWEDWLADVSVGTWAADVIELMIHLDLEDAVVTGLSMGGYVAFEVLRRAPGRVSGLVLANTRASADGPEARQARDAMIARVREHGPAAVADDMLPKLLGETTRREQPDLEEAVRRLILLNSADGIAAAVAALRDRSDATPLLGGIRCPVTVIAGEEDVVVPVRECEAMAAAIPGARLIVLPRAGHLSNLEAASGFSDALQVQSAG